MDADAIIIHSLLNYKIVNTNQVILPKEALPKVIKKLEESSISYEIDHEKHRFLNNNYDVFRNYAFNKLSYEKRIDKIISYINKMDERQIDDLLNYLERYFYE